MNTSCAFAPATHIFDSNLQLLWVRFISAELDTVSYIGSNKGYVAMSQQSNHEKAKCQNKVPAVLKWP